MSYVAEPFGQFVDDLLVAMTGGVTRESFRFIKEEEPYRLSPPGVLFPGTLQVFGQATGSFRGFRRDVDYELSPEQIIVWKARPDGTPVPDAVWPDEGTPFFANYDYRAIGGALPALTDRNVGSVTRLLAESLGRELAVLSKQLESVYQSAFIATATGRDLDQLVTLVGVTRRTDTFAEGTVVFSRGTPAPADIFVPAGTKLSTAAPPIVVFETTEDRTLHRGVLSVEVPIQATVPGALGVVGPRAVSVIHRPILGIEAAANPQAPQLGSADESDELLRARTRRALESAGKASVGALLGALTTLSPDLREKYIRLDEDPIKRPGLVSLAIAATLTTDQAVRAVQLIEATRPAGVRVLHDLDVPETLGGMPPGANPRDVDPSASSLGDPEDEDDDGSDTTTSAKPLFQPVVVKAVLLPASSALTPSDRTALAQQGQDAVTALLKDVGIGETLVYNRLVSALMDVDGVLDVVVDLYKVGDTTTSRRQNLDTPATLRPTVEAAHGGSVVVEVGGELVAFDVTLAVTLRGLALDATVEPELAREVARLAVLASLTDGIEALTEVTPASLRGLVHDAPTFTITSLSYEVEYLDAGVKVNKSNPTLTLDNRQRPWIRRVRVSGTGA